MPTDTATATMTNPSHRRHHRHHSSKDQPPSTLKVLTYVAFVWFAWGIFTHADETDHLRPPASLRTAAHYAHTAMHDGERAVEDGYNGLMGAWDGYQGMQRSENGVYSLSFPKSPVSQRGYGQSNKQRGWFATLAFGIWSTATYLVIYPLIALFNVVSFILHYISVTFLMILTTAYYLSWPLHQLLGIVFSTLTTPMNIAWALIRWTEPLWTLAGGLVTAGATFGGAFAWLGNKAEHRVYASHEARQERARLEQLEREIEQRELELERERQRADEQERRNRALQLQGITRRRFPHRATAPKSLLAVLFDKVFGSGSSFGDQVDEYYADLELLEPPAGARIVAWDVDAPVFAQYEERLGSGDEEERERELAFVAAAPRLMIAPPDSLKKRIRRASAHERTPFVPTRAQGRHLGQSIVHPQVMHHHHHYRPPVAADLHSQSNRRSGETAPFIPDIHHHVQDDSLPPVHTPPADGLPPTPRRTQPQQPFMTFPTGNLVRAGGTRTRNSDRRPVGGSGRRITFAAVEGDRVGREEAEGDPVEGEVFGLSDDEAGDEVDPVMDADEEEPGDAQGGGPSSIHLHFHNGSAPAPTRRKRTLRFQDDPSPEPSHQIAQGDNDHLQDKYGTPFKRSSTRLGKQLKQAFEAEESAARDQERNVGPAGMLFG